MKVEKYDTEIQKRLFAQTNHDSLEITRIQKCLT